MLFFKLLSILGKANFEDNEDDNESSLSEQITLIHSLEEKNERDKTLEEIEEYIETHPTSLKKEI